MLQWAEVMVGVVGILVVPTLIFFVKNIRQSLIHQILMIVNEHYTSLENLIDHNREKINNLDTKFTHKAEITSLKYNEILGKLTDIETYLEKTNGYRRRGYITRIEAENDE